MNDKEEKSTSISRRDFVKNTGVIAAAGIARLVRPVHDNETKGGTQLWLTK